MISMVKVRQGNSLTINRNEEFMIQLAAFDMDGTLIEKGTRRLPESTVETIKKLKQRGITQVLASGRTIKTLDAQVMKRIAFDYIMCGNGTYLVDKNGNLLFKSQLDHHLVLRLIQDFEQYKGALNIRYEEGSHTFCGMSFFKSYTEKFLGKDNHATDNYYPFDYENCIAMSGLCYIPEAHHAYFKDKYKELAFVHAGVDEYYDITLSEDNKGNALCKLCEMLGISIENTIVFGDDKNDLKMIASAGIGVAMGNAVDSIKEAADYVTDDCMKDGIRNACQYFKLI